MIRIRRRTLEDEHEYGLDLKLFLSATGSLIKDVFNPPKYQDGFLLNFIKLAFRHHFIIF